MAQHGYLREYDEDWERRDNGRDRAPERADDRERPWPGSDADRSRADHDRLDRDRGSDRPRRDFMLGDREDGYARSEGDHRSSGGPEAGSGEWGDRGRPQRNFSSHQDDHYRSWRDRQMSALDRDYEEYCREREQQFHRDFDSWRQERHSYQRPTGSGRQELQQADQGSVDDVMELDNPTDQSTEAQSGPSPTADATLGTNNSENAGLGRGGR